MGNWLLWLSGFNAGLVVHYVETQGLDADTAMLHAVALILCLFGSWAWG
jgi:hypothetical protein